MTGGLGGAQGRAPNSVQGRVQHNHKTESEMSEGMTDSIIQPLTKSFLSSCCVPGNVLYARRDTQLNKTEPISRLLTAWKGPGGASQWRHSTSRPAMCALRQYDWQLLQENDHAYYYYFPGPTTILGTEQMLRRFMRHGVAWSVNLWFE